MSSSRKRDRLHGGCPEDDLEAVLRLAGVSAFVAEPETATCLYGTPEFASLTGYPAEQLQGMPLAELMPAPCLAGWRTCSKDMAEGDTGDMTMQLVLRPGLGPRQPVNARLALSSGKPARVVTVLEAAETPSPGEVGEAAHQLLDSLPEIAFETDTSGVLTFINEAACSRLGYDRADLGKQLSLLDIVPPEERPIAERHLECALQGQVFEGLGYTVVHRDGTREPVLVHAWPVYERKRIIGTRGLALSLSHLRETEELLDVTFRAVAASINGIALADKKGCLTYINQAFLDMWGYAREEEVLGQHLSDLWVDSREAAALFEYILSDGSYRGELKARKAGGEPMDVALTASLVRDRSGAPLNVMASFVDVTERKQAQAAIRDSELRFRRLVENIREVFWMEDAAGSEVLYVSPAYEQIWGRRLADLPAHPIPWKASILPEDRDRVVQSHAGGRVRGTYVEEYRIQRPDGSIRWIFDRGSPVYDEDGKLVAVAGVAEDITARKKSREEAARLAAVVESAPYAIFSLDAGGVITSWNPAARQIYGYAPADIVGQPIGKLLPEDCGQEADDMAAVASNGSCFQKTDTTHVSRNGDRLRIACIATPIRHRAGKVLGGAVIARDITQEMELKERLRLAEKMEAVGQLAGGVAHDFNNLLMVIMSGAQFAMQDLPADSPIVTELEGISQAASQARDLTSQLLIFSRKHEMNRRTLDLNNVVTDLRKMLRRLIPENITIHLDLTTDRLPLYADMAQLQQVVMNLAVNGRDAMPDGGQLRLMTARRELSEREAASLAGTDQPGAGTYATLTVEDTGTGMSREVLAHLFEPFFTTKAEGHGTGLGLSTVYGIVRKHNGCVNVDSQPDGGTAFTVLLPMQETSVQYAVGGTPEGSNEACDLLNRTVLLVEDETTVRRGLVRRLKHAGCCVYDAASAEKAIQVVDGLDVPVDVLVSDIVLPGKDGRELATILKARYPVMRVILMSGYPDKRISSGQGECRYLAKPFSPDTLLNAIREELTLNA